MILDNEIAVKAPPAEVFALINDVRRVVTCVPGASIDSVDGDVYRGGVKVKVGPISAAYSGTARFLEVDHEKRHLRLQARGADVKGSGDAEAEVTLDVEDAPDGSILRLSTDLVIRGKIAQFGKGAIVVVSNKLLQQFATNLANLLEGGEQAAEPAPLTAASVLPTPSPSLRKYGPLAGAFALGLFEGWLLSRLRSQSRELKELRRGR